MHKNRTCRVSDLISIIIPVYNVENSLTRCVESLINQTYSETEIILINDGSSDASSLVCDDFARKFINIKVIHQTNAGPAKARNNGLKIASGQYVTFVDSDDFVHPMYLEFLRAEILKNNVDLSICGYAKLPVDLVPHNDNPMVSHSQILSDTEAFESLLKNQELCAPWAKMYNIDLFQDITFLDYVLYEDMFFTPQVFKKAKRISISTSRLYCYSQESESITRSSFNPSKMTQYFNASKYWQDFALENYPNLSRKFTMHFYRNILNLCKEVNLSVNHNKEVMQLCNTYKNFVLDHKFKLLISKDFPLKDKIKLILLMVNYY